MGFGVKVSFVHCKFEVGAPGGTRTPGLLVRSQSLYPAELRARGLMPIVSFPHAVFVVNTPEESLS
jgi:hypothetical protein